MALGIGHINKLFEPGHAVPDLAKVAAQLRLEATNNAAAKGLLEAMEMDFPELKTPSAPPERKPKPALGKIVSSRVDAPRRRAKAVRTPRHPVRAQER